VRAPGPPVGPVFTLAAGCHHTDQTERRSAESVSRRVRWLLVAGLGLALAAVGVALVSWFVLRTWGPALARERVEVALTDALGRPVRVDRVALRPWLARVDLYGVHVGAEPTAPDGTRLDLGRAGVSVRLASLWRRELVLSITLTDVDLRIEARGEGAQPPVAFAMPERLTLGPVVARIGAVQLSRGRVRYEDPTARRTVVLDGLAARGLPRAGDLDLQVWTETLQVTLPGLDERLERVEAEARVGPEAIAPARVSFRWGGREIRLVGAVRSPWTAPELALTAAGAVDLEALARRLGIGWRLSGLARLDGTLDGPIAALRVSAEVAVPELRLGPLTFARVTARGGWSEGTLRVEDLQARLFDGNIRASATIVTTGTPETRLALHLERVSVPGPLAALGAATADAEARVRENAVELTRAVVQWPGLGLDAGGRIMPGGALDVRGRVAADLSRLPATRQWTGLAGEATATAEATGWWDRPQIAGRLEGGPLTVAGWAVERVAAPFALTGGPDPAGGAWRWTGSLDGGRIGLAPFAVDRLHASFAIDGAALTVPSLRAEVAGLPVRLTGAWAWAGTGRATAELGPAALDALPGVSPPVALAGRGEARVEATLSGGTAVASASVALTDVAVARVPLGSGTGTVKLRGRSVEADVGFPARRLTASAQGHVGEGSVFAVRAALDALEVAPLVRTLAPAVAGHVDGVVSADARLEVPGSQPAAGRGVIRLDPVRLRLAGEPWESRGPVVLRWTGSSVALERLHLEGAAGALTGSGTLTQDGREGRLALALANARLPAALGALGRGTARVEARLSGDIVELTRAEARWPAINAEASGQFALDGPLALRGRLLADLGPVAAARRWGGVTGRAMLALEARGRWDAPDVAGRLEAPALGVAGTTLAGVEVPFRVVGKTLEVEWATAALGGSRATAGGTATWTGVGAPTPERLGRDLRGRLEVRVPAGRMEDLAPWLPTALRGSGRFDLAARLEGTPARWQGAGTLEATRLTLAHGDIAELRARFALDGDGIELTTLRAQALGVPVVALGAYRWSGTGRATAELGPARLESLRALGDLPVAGGAAGHVAATTGAGVVVAATGTLDFDGVTLAGVPLDRGRLTATLQGAELHAELAFPRRRLAGTADGRLASGSAIGARLTVEDLDVGALLRERVPARAGPIEGVLSARADVHVPVDRPAATRATLAVEPLRLSVAGEPWESRGPVVARWEAGGLRLERLQLAGGAGTVTASGVVAGAGALDLRVDGRLPLAILPAVRPEVREADGTLEVTAQLTGPATRPEIGGEGAIREGRLLLRDYPEGLRDLQARFTMSPRGLRLLEASAGFGGGQVRARGDLALDGWTVGAYQLALTARGVSVSLLEGLSTAWDADLELVGLTARPLLRGEARLVRGSYTRDLSLLSLVLPERGGGPTEPTFALPLRVRARLDDNLVVRNRTARLRVGGTLTVEGTTAAPVVFGTLESREGQITFRGHRFTVASASVRFVDPRRINPFLDVVATARIKSYDVTVALSGHAEDLAVRLSSTPPLPQEDLLALVTFGVTRAEFARSAGGLVAGEAAQVLVRELIGVDAQGGLGLDVMDVETTGEGAGTLRVGKRLTERAVVIYSQSLADSGRRGVRVEYELFGPLLIAGQQNLGGDYAADLILRLRFR
jgi:autotransporter translocation and assembly factor TamB